MAFGFQNGSRINIIAAFLFLATGIVAVRLFQLQILHHDRYVLLAYMEHVERFTIPARRGLIFAMERGTPVPFVMNRTVYTLFVDPQLIASTNTAEPVERIIREVAGGNLATPDLTASISATPSRYQVVAHRLSRVQAELIRAEGLAGIGFHGRTERVHIEDTLASQTIGFVNFDGVGQYGIEASFDARLRGRDGLLQTVTDVAQVPLTLGDHNMMQPAQHGEDIVITLDRNIQSFTEQALKNGLQNIGANRGSAIVMNPNTGEILAMANYPTYDVTQFYTVTNQSLFHNAVLSDPFEPGSTIKPFTIAAGIDRGIITAQSTYINTDFVYIDGLRISNHPISWGRHQGHTTFQTAHDWSLNTGMINIAQRLDSNPIWTTISRPARDIMFDYFHNRFNFGRPTGVQIYEATGLIPRPDIPHAPGHQYAVMTFGQGMNLTMLQVATGFSTLVNGGYLVEPTILAGTMEGSTFIPEPARQRTRVITQSTSDQITNIMLTSRRSVWFSDLDPPGGFRIGGKTGTSETRNPDGTMNQDATIATYIGFTGNNTQKYVIMVRVQGDDLVLEGATAAQPIFADISNWIIRYLNLRPNE